jgi:short chain dehydrogenase
VWLSSLRRTGSTSGIGHAVALKLARDGFEVIVHGRDTARGAETVEEITRSGGRARFVLADLCDPSGVQRLAEDAGDIDVLVNNGGSATGGLDAALGEELLDRRKSIGREIVVDPFLAIAMLTMDVKQSPKLYGHRFSKRTTVAFRIEDSLTRFVSSSSPFWKFDDLHPYTLFSSSD